MQSHQADAKTEDSFSCPVKLEPMRFPVTLDCDLDFPHVVELDVAHDLLQKDNPCCPLCNKNISSYQPNRFVHTLINDYYERIEVPVNPRYKSKLDISQYKSYKKPVAAPVALPPAAPREEKKPQPVAEAPAVRVEPARRDAPGDIDVLGLTEEEKVQQIAAMRQLEQEQAARKPSPAQLEELKKNLQAIPHKAAPVEADVAAARLPDAKAGIAAAGMFADSEHEILFKACRILNKMSKEVMWLQENFMNIDFLTLGHLDGMSREHDRLLYLNRCYIGSAVVHGDVKESHILLLNVSDKDKYKKSFWARTPVDLVEYNPAKSLYWILKCCNPICELVLRIQNVPEHGVERFFDDGIVAKPNGSEFYRISPHIAKLIVEYEPKFDAQIQITKDIVTKSLEKSSCVIM